MFWLLFVSNYLQVVSQLINTSDDPTNHKNNQQLHYQIRLELQ